MQYFSVPTTETIEQSDQPADPRRTAEEQMLTRDALNTVLDRILHEWEQPEAITWRLMLAGVTAQWGLAFNRAILFRPDKDRRLLIGSLGVGHLTKAEAEHDWSHFPFFTLEALIEHVLHAPVTQSALQTAIQQIQLPLARKSADLLVEVYLDNRPVLGTRREPHLMLPDILVRTIHQPHEFALVPLRTRDNTLGVLYVDNIFSEQPITDDAFTLLQTFGRQTAVAIDNQRALAVARDRELRERLTNLAAGLIHEINNALADIPDLVDEIKRGLQASEDVTIPLEDLVRIAEATMQIATRLNDFAIGTKLNLTRVTVDPVILAVLKITKESKPAHIQIRYEPPAFPAQVQIDQLWIQLLLKNLILNAYNAIPSDSQGLIRISVAGDDRTIQIKLTDNGIGIPAENLNRIFEYGYTTASDRRPSLLHGIGLFFCRQIAHEHGGQIDAESTLGQGTTFTLRLPKPNSLDG